MKLIPLSQHSKKNKGKYFAKVDDEDYELLNAYQWTAHHFRNGIYATRNQRINGKRKTILMHRVILNLYYSINQGDHIDRDTLNNQRANLRSANNRENCFNRAGKKNTTSKYKGVYKYTRGNCIRWCASINYGGKCLFHGYFKNEDEAALAYNKKAAEMFGEFAFVNII